MKRNDVLRILTDHRDELQERFGVSSLALFGSVARDEAVDASDVDLLVEFDRRITLFGLVEVQQYLEQILQVENVDLVLRDAVFAPLKPYILGDAIDVFEKRMDVSH